MNNPYTTEELDALLMACINFTDEQNEKSFYAGNIAGREGVSPDSDTVKRMLEWMAEKDSGLLVNQGFGKDNITYFFLGHNARQIMGAGGFKRFVESKSNKATARGEKASNPRNPRSNRSGSQESNPSILTSEGLILTAKKAVPSFKWALAGAACLALAGVIIGAVVKGGISFGALFLVVGVILVLAVAFLALHWVSKLKPEKTSAMAAFFAWSLLLMLVLSLGCVLSSAVANKPWRLRDKIEEMISPTGMVDANAVVTRRERWKEALEGFNKRWHDGIVVRSVNWIPRASVQTPPVWQTIDIDPEAPFSTAP